MGAWVAWVKFLNFYVGCVGCVGRTIFYMGQHFTWIIAFASVVWVKYIFAWVNIFHVVQSFLRTFNFFAGLIFLKIFLGGWAEGEGSKKILIDALTLISELLCIISPAIPGLRRFWRQFFANFFHLRYVWVKLN